MICIAHKMFSRDNHLLVWVIWVVSLFIARNTKLPAKIGIKICSVFMFQVLDFVQGQARRSRSIGE